MLALQYVALAARMGRQPRHLLDVLTARRRTGQRVTAEERAEIVAEIDEIRARAVRRLEMPLVDDDRRLEWLRLGRMEIRRLERLLEREG